MASIEPTSAAGARLDLWLWTSRQFRTRGIAVDAIAIGRIELNGVRAKPAKLVRAGDIITIRRPPYEHEIIVRALSPKRVSAKLAQGLYDETPRSITAREQLRENLARYAIIEDRRAGKLNKKERRQREHLKRSYD
jgi:ribosome-associated heat shock protein Hsp15